MKIDYTPTLKQHELFEAINDTETYQILYGGSAGGGKSYGICAIITLLCLTKQNIRIGLGRKNLSTLKKTTLISLFEVFNDWGLKPDIDYTYNQQNGTIIFNNKSEIVLVDLQYYPSDPEYQRLGGLLLTMAFIDEAGELVDDLGYNILSSRTGRWKNKELGLKSMIISTCNPSSNFLKEKFYQLYTEDRLPNDLKFIPALLTDNPNLSKDYYDNLERSLDPISKKRLLYGLWDYDQSDLDLFLVDDINAMYIKKDNPIDELYLTVDVAVDRDDTVGIIWKGLEIADIVVANREIPNDIFIKDVLDNYKIKVKNLIFDASGVGNDLKRKFPLAKPFFGNGKVIGKKVNYRNLRHQCYFKLSELVSEGLITISTQKEKERLKRELMVVKRSEIILGKVEIINKKEIKRLLGASPDISDAIMMRMMFELKPQFTKQF